MNIEELVTALLKFDSIEHLEIRREDGYWFVDAMSHAGHPQPQQEYGFSLVGALQDLWRNVK